MKLVKAVIFNMLASLGLLIILAIPLAIYKVELNELERVFLIMIPMLLVIWLGNEYCFDICDKKEEKEDVEH